MHKEHIPEVMNKLMPFAKIKVLQDKEFLIQQGCVSKEITWIKKGMLRSFYLSEKNEEITYCFGFEGSLMTALSSYISNSPTQENIQSVGETELLSVQKEVIDKLCVNSLEWTIFFKQLIEDQFIELEDKLFNIQKYSAKTRYLKLLENQPQYIHNIPLQYLATFLNVTPRHLSRIRKEIRF